LIVSDSIPSTTSCRDRCINGSSICSSSDSIARSPSLLVFYDSFTIRAIVSTAFEDLFKKAIPINLKILINSLSLYEIIEDARQKLVTFHEAMMLTGKINPVTGIFLAKANYGYVETVNIEIASRQPINEISLEEIERRIPKNLPVDVNYTEE
jgi:hypothetical protein